MQPASTGEPSYVALLESGELKRRAAEAWRRLESCDLCARYCRVNRLTGINGAVCRTGERAVVASHGPHHGEEDVLRGRRGSGTIMDQYRPCYRASEHPPLNRPLAREEYRCALAAAHRHGLRRLDSRVSWRDYWM